jgi:hypothetical protein
MSDEEKFSAEQQGNSREALEKAAMQDQQMQDVHAQLMREKEEPTEGFSPCTDSSDVHVCSTLFLGRHLSCSLFGRVSVERLFALTTWQVLMRPKPVEISLFDRGAQGLPQPMCTVPPRPMAMVCLVSIHRSRALNG